MPNIYMSENMYFMKQDDKYILCDIMIKRNTIVIMETDEYTTELVDPVIYTYQELKNKLLGRQEAPAFLI